MPNSRIAVWIFSSLMMILAARLALGQEYPSKLIRIITAEAGGGADFVARMIAQELTHAVGQQVLVDNRGGGNGIIAIETVLKASPDGYVLLLYSNSLWILPFMQKVSYDPIVDFLPITLAVRSPNFLVVHPSLPVNSVRGLITLAKAKPGVLNYGTSAVGNRIAAELFKSMSGVNIVHIAYKGTNQALTALITGEVQLAFPTGAGVTPHIKSGRLKALAVTSSDASALAPGLPTIAQTVPGYEVIQVYGVFAPARMSESLQKRLNQEIVRILSRADVKEKLLNNGVEVLGSSPGESTAMIKADMLRMGKVIKDAGIAVN